MLQGLADAVFFDMEEPFILKEYHSYADVHLNEFEIPENVVMATFDFMVLTKERNCPRQVVSM